MSHNFIVLRLCDNDYQLLEGLQALLADWDVEHLLKAGPQVVKECVIDMVVARMDVSDRIRGYKGTNERSRDYLGRDTDTSADMTRWRDAGVQDLSELGRLNHKE